MQTNLERAAWAVLGCAAAMVLAGCGSSTTTHTTVTTTTTDAGGSTTTVTTTSASTDCAVGGTVSGLGADDSVTLLNNGGDAVIVGGNGAFTFPTRLAGGSAYAVSMQSHTPGIACSVSDGSGTVVSSDVTGVAVSCGAGKETILYSFAGGAAGAVPMAGLIMDSSGNFYGTTQQGGKHSRGTVFELSADGTETVLHSFGDTGSDGRSPQAALVMDSAGNLYGTTPAGGAHGDGTIFKVAADGTETILYSFGVGRDDGQNPGGGLVMDSAGNLYGTTQHGGAYRAGTVFKLSPAGTETVLHSFYALGMAADGQNPQGTLVMDSAGNLYGTTLYGGAGTAGTVFEVSADGTETVLYSFGSGAAADGSTPHAGVILDDSGNLYGTTVFGGANGSGHGDGTVFKLSAVGKETVLYSFGGSATDGLNPDTGLVMDGAGNLFGTTQGGGARGNGIVFELSAAGTETILYSFAASGATDGSAPHAALLLDSTGNLFGTTQAGGAHGHGTVFKID